MIDEEEYQKKQNKIIEIIKYYIKPDLLSKTWNNDGILVTKYITYIRFILYIKDFNGQRKI